MNHDSTRAENTGCRMWPHERRLPEAVPGVLHLYQTASAIVCHDPAGIPPMLETGETAAVALQALLSDYVPFGEHAEARQQHRDLINGACGPDIVCYLREAGLRRLPGNKNVRLAQFLALAMLRDDERVQLRVVPEMVKHLVPAAPFSIIRRPDELDVVVAPTPTATFVLAGRDDLAAYDVLVGTLDKAALSTADSARLIMGLPVLPEPVPEAVKEFADEVKQTPVEQRSGPVQECFRAILRALADANRNLNPDEIRATTHIPRGNLHYYLQVLLRERMITSMPGLHDPDRTIQDAPRKSYTATAGGLAYLVADPKPHQRDSGRDKAAGKPIMERSEFFQSQLRDILWVLSRAGGYQTIEEIAEATAFWREPAGQMLGVLFRENMVDLMTGDHRRLGFMVRDSGVKSYAITPTGLAYLCAAPCRENWKLRIATRRAAKKLP